MKRKFAKILSVMMTILIITSTCVFAAVDVEGDDINSEVFSAYVNDFVQGDGKIRVNFSKTIDTDTLAGNVKLFVADGIEIPVRYAATSNKLQLIVTPQNELEVGKEYAVVLNGVKDGDGSLLKNNSCYFKIDAPKSTTVSSYIYNEDFSGITSGTQFKKSYLAVLADDGEGASVAADPVSDGTRGNVFKWQANDKKVVIGGYGNVYKAWWDRNDYSDYASAKDIIIEFDTYIEAASNTCSPIFKIINRNDGQSFNKEISSIFFNSNGAQAVIGEIRCNLLSLGLESAYGRWVNVKAIRRFNGNASTVEWYIDGKCVATIEVDSALNVGTNLIYITQQNASNTNGVTYYDNIKVGYAEERFNTVGNASNYMLGETNGKRESTGLTGLQNRLVEVEFTPKPVSGKLENKSAYLTLYSSSETSKPKIMFAYVGEDGSLGFYKEPFAVATTHITAANEVDSISSDANTNGMKYWYTAVDAVKANEKTNIKAYIDVVNKSVSYYVNNSFIGMSKTDDVNNLIPAQVGANVINSTDKVDIAKYSITSVKNNFAQKMRITSGNELFGFKSDGIGNSITALTVEYLKSINLDGAKILITDSNGTETDVTEKANASENVVTVSDIELNDGDYTFSIKGVNDTEDYTVKFAVKDNGVVTATGISAVYSNGTAVSNGNLIAGNDVYATATVKNTKLIEKKAVVIMAQYNKEKNALIDANFVNITVPAGGSVSISKDTETKLTTKISTDCGKISVFVWSDFTNLIPYGMSVAAER